MQKIQKTTNNIYHKMKKTISYLYSANDKGSFMALAKLVHECNATVTINPKAMSITVTADERQVDGSAADPIHTIGKIIDDGSLDFRITPIDMATLQDALDYANGRNKELESQLKRSEDIKKHYGELCQKEANANARIRRQVAAIGTLVEAICK